MGVGAAEALGGGQQNVLGGRIRIGEHVRVPQTDHAPAERLQICCATRIRSRRFDMLATIEFDRELRLLHAKSMMKGASTCWRVKGGW